MAKKYGTTRYKTDEEFISEFMRETNVSKEKADIYVKAFADCIKKCVELNGVLNIRGLGIFALKSKKNIKVKSYKTGENKLIPIIYRVLFDASFSFRNLINAKVRKSLKDMQ